VLSAVVTVMVILAILGVVVLVSLVVFAWRHGERSGRPSEYEGARGRWWAG